VLKILLAVMTLVGGIFIGGESETPRAGDVVFLRARGGITLARDPAGTFTRIPTAISSTDWSAVVQTIRHGRDTRIAAFDAISGQELWSRVVDGRLEAKVASTDARFVALGYPGWFDANGYPLGQPRTSLVILSQDATEPHVIELDGNYAPEAFSTDGNSLFVIQYLPARHPNRYRVRRLDLATERVVGVYSVDADLQEAMQGTARVQAASPDGRRLYTLYTVDGPDGTRRAFVHVLSLDELWAHCVDLPTAFAEAPEKSIALSVSPDGDRVYAADTSSGTLAEIDTKALAVSRTAELLASPRGGVAQAAVGSNGLVYVARDTGVTALDASTLSPIGTWQLGDRITGLQPARDGLGLYVGLNDRILVLDGRTGTQLRTLDPPEAQPIDQLGEATRPLDTARTVIECAC
jgi:YVTN family beta-propeller protein